MKKRIISLLLAVFTLLQIMPAGILTAAADDGVMGIAFEELEVGVKYRAEFVEDFFEPMKKSPFISTWDDYNSGLLDDFALELDSIPGAITVKRMSEGDFRYVYITNGDWPAEYNDYRYIEDYNLTISDGNNVVNSAEDMEIGVTYYAFWSLIEGANSISPCRKETDESKIDYIVYDYVDVTNEIPTELIVELKHEDDEALYVTNTDWPLWLDNYRYIYVEDSENWGYIVVTGVYTPDEPDTPNEPDEDGLVRGEVSLKVDGEALTGLTIAAGDHVYVFTELSDKFTGEPEYRWQLCIDSENGKWADIQYYVNSYATISEALLVNAGIDGNGAVLRCIASYEGVNYVSSELNIIVDKNATPAEVPDVTKSAVPMKAVSEPMMAAEPTEISEPVMMVSEPVVAAASTPMARSTDAFQITVDYIYRHATADDIDGDTAANMFQITWPSSGEGFKGSIMNPTSVVGYRPYVLEADAHYLVENQGDPLPQSIVYDGKTYYPAPVLYLNVMEKTSIDVFYIPQDVSFYIYVYEQDLYSDEYLHTDTILINSNSPEPYRQYARKAGEDISTDQRLAFEREGFTALYYDPTMKVSGDSSTHLEIYYDRNYYLVKFDLGFDEAYGATPYYVRYGTQVALPNPTNPGYKFTEWTLDRVYNVLEDKTEQNIEDENIKAEYDKRNAGNIVTVYHNVDYLANWSISTAAYTIIYWRENADSTSAADKRNYSVWATQTVENVLSGSTINCTSINIPTTLTSERNYFTRANAMSDKTVVVKGDNSTVVNIYYTRNTYHILFSGIPGTNVAYNHRHGTNCERELLCHAHDQNCTSTLICAIPEHTLHTNECLICGKTTHEMHTDECLKGECDLCTAHSHSCYAGAGNSKPGGNTRIEGTAQEGYIGRSGNWFYYQYWIYISGQWYSYSGSVNYGNKATPICHYQHTEDCYKDELHSHVDSCYRDVIHTHTNGCYSYVCPDVDNGHTHSDDCYAPCTLYTNNNTNYIWTISAKYGANISDVWPTAEKVQQEINSDYKLYAWNSTWVTKRVTMTTDMCDTNDGILTITPTSTSSDYYSLVYYMFESFDQTSPASGNDRRQNNNRFYDSDEDYYQKIYGLDETLSQKNITGMSKVTTNGVRTETIDRNSMRQFLYYNRNRHVINFENVGVQMYSITDVMFEQPLNAAFFNTRMMSYGDNKEQWDFVDANGNTVKVTIPIPNRPLSYEEGAVYFAGWYTTPLCVDGTEFNFANSEMPDADVTLFAKWETCYYTANVYLDSGKTVKLCDPQYLEFNSQIVEPKYETAQNNSQHKGSIFAGWYYMDGTEEKRFDFNTMVLKGDMDIYAKWTSIVPVNYVVYYVIEDNNGDLTYNGGKYSQIAEPTRGQSLASKSKNFTAKTGAALDDGYQVAYFPDRRAHSMVMSGNEEENVYCFIYSAPSTISYRVVHNFISDSLVEHINTNQLSIEYTIVIDTETSPSIHHTSALISVSFRNGVTEENLLKAAQKIKPSLTDGSQAWERLWDLITHLSPNAIEQNLVLTTEQENLIVFEWTGRDQTSLFQIVYYKETLDGVYEFDHSVERVGNIDAKVQIIPEGSSADGDTKIEIAAESIPGFEVNKSLGLLKGEITQIAFDNSGNITGGLVLRVYYTRKVYNYTVNHYLANSTTKLADSQTGTAKYETVINVVDVQASIPGYGLVNDYASYKITTDNQEINCYYVGLDVIYNYLVRGGRGGSLFPYQITAKVGAQPTPSDLTIDKGYILKEWCYVDPISGEEIEVPDEWLLNDNLTIQPPAPEAIWAQKTVVIYADLVPTKLTISARISVNTPAMPSYAEDQGFIYRITGEGVSLDVAVPEGGSVTVIGLPVGQYTITEESGWAWRYEGAQDTVIVDSDDVTWGYAYSPRITEHISSNAYNVITQPPTDD